MTPNIAALFSALDTALSQVTIATAANELAAQQAAAAIANHQKTYAVVRQATQAMAVAKQALREAEDKEYAVPDNGQDADTSTGSGPAVPSSPPPALAPATAPAAVAPLAATTAPPAATAGASPSPAAAAAVDRVLAVGSGS
jgi:hypothetical protein